MHKMDKQKVILFGNGQVASVAYAYLTSDSQYEVAAFTVDRDQLREPTLFGLPVVPFDEVEVCYPVEAYRMLVSISFRRMNHLRAEKYVAAKAKGYQLISYLSSRALTWPGLEIGDNCYVIGNTVIEPFARIGNNVHIGSGCHIGHHTVIHDHSFLAAHVAVAGTVTIGPYSFLGMNATVRDGVSIASESVIGAGAGILQNTQERGVYIGTKGRLLPLRSNELAEAL
jgi:sugar O-acyltransferase (sialic acid O-acetyltransferase NeuD family)